MSLIAGLCGFADGGTDEFLLRTVARVQRAGVDAGAAPDLKVAALDGARFAASGPADPGADGAVDPPVVRSGLLVVADARLDNRAELLARLDLPAAFPGGDGALLCRLWEREREAALQRARGDFALAVWDSQARELVLARDYTGQRPLHFFRDSRFAAFASMPHGLLALPGVSGAFDEALIAQFVADIPRGGAQTYFRDVARVEPGQIVRIDRHGVTARTYWRPPRTTLRLPGEGQYVEALREQLDRAVARRLAGAPETIGAHLSAGLDSGGVAATAARLMARRGGRVTAFTSAPRAGFDGPLPRGRIADEVDLAAAVVALHPNLEQQVIRAEGVSPLAIMRRDSLAFGEPLGLPCNQVWWASIADAASAAGIGIVLTGESGNMAFSSGGAATLSQFVRRGALRRLGREALALRRNGLRWRGIAYAAAGPWLPSPLWSGLLRWYWGRSTASEGEALLTARARRMLPRALEARSRSGRPPADHRLWRGALIQAADPGAFRKGTLLRWGIDERDPTTDRELVEFCLSVPSEQLLNRGVTRSLARRALADRLPPQIIDGPRGYQGADWYERVDAAALAQLLDEIGAAVRAEGVIDAPSLARIAASWPATGTDAAAGSVISRYRYGLLRALSAAVFMAEFRDFARAAALR